MKLPQTGGHRPARYVARQRRASDPALLRPHPGLRTDFALGRTDPGLLVGVNGPAGRGSLRTISELANY
jgi:hypothetical protein